MDAALALQGLSPHPGDTFSPCSPEESTAFPLGWEYSAGSLPSLGCVSAMKRGRSWGCAGPGPLGAELQVAHGGTSESGEAETGGGAATQAGGVHREPKSLQVETGAGSNNQTLQRTQMPVGGPTVAQWVKNLTAGAWVTMDMQV